MTNLMRGLALLVLLAVVLVLRESAGEAGRRLATDVIVPTAVPATDSQTITLAFQQVARDLNAAGPQQMDSSVRADSATAGPGPRLTYFSTLTRMRSDVADSASLADLYSTELARSACGKMRASIRRGATAVYVYSGSDGRRIMSFTVGESDCVRAGVP